MGSGPKPGITFRALVVKDKDSVIVSATAEELEYFNDGYYVCTFTAAPGGGDSGPDDAQDT